MELREDDGGPRDQQPGGAAGSDFPDLRLVFSDGHAVSRPSRGQSGTFGTHEFCPSANVIAACLLCCFLASASSTWRIRLNLARLGSVAFLYSYRDVNAVLLWLVKTAIVGCCTLLLCWRRMAVL